MMPEISVMRQYQIAYRWYRQFGCDEFVSSELERIGIGQYARKSAARSWWYARHTKSQKTPFWQRYGLVAEEWGKRISLGGGVLVTIVPVTLYQRRGKHG